ncbi:MAG: hypothetical protein ACI9XJ_002374 [Marivirga sp.]|jgi:hypothetical protein
MHLAALFNSNNETNYSTLSAILGQYVRSSVGKHPYVQPNF